jgi:ubiquinone/menaquinone biosynthesis C-methylase UbiE
MPDYEQIYSKQADQYERLITREDYEGNLWRALSRIRPPERLDVVELGAGTGRLTCWLAPVVKTIHAFDASPAMLDLAIGKLAQTGQGNWHAQVADHRRLPIGNQVADLVISGWSICYTVVGYRDTWQTELGQALAEIKRVARPGGTIVILETLGTGYETPHPPEELAEYYAFLEASGFASTWIRTDYRFDSMAEAQTLARFFFGDEMLAKIVAAERPILPECTGIWWRKAS